MQHVLVDQSAHIIGARGLAGRQQGEPSDQRIAGDAHIVPAANLFVALVVEQRGRRELVELPTLDLDHVAGAVGEPVR